MSMLQCGPLRVRALGSSDRSAPAIILCHGYGAPGDDLVPLARAMDVGPGVRWFFPEAPLTVDLGFDAVGEPGRAWWPVDMMRLQMELARGGRQWDPSETPEGMPEARDALFACLRALIDEHGVDPGRTILGGFSQGAMIATDASLLLTWEWPDRRKGARPAASGCPGCTPVPPPQEAASTEVGVPSP